MRRQGRRSDSIGEQGRWWHPWEDECWDRTEESGRVLCWRWEGRGGRGRGGSSFVTDLAVLARVHRNGVLNNLDLRLCWLIGC